MVTVIMLYMFLQSKRLVCKVEALVNHEAEAEAEAFENHEAEAEAEAFENHEAEAEAEARLSKF